MWFCKESQLIYSNKNLKIIKLTLHNKGYVITFYMYTRNVTNTYRTGSNTFGVT